MRGDSTLNLARVLFSFVLLAFALAVSVHARQSTITAPVSLAGEQVGDAASTSTLPAVAEHRYRMAGKIRLLLPWVGPDNVGGARIVWRRGANAERGWELLIGSDPARAPRHINRWGYVREEAKDGELSMLGVMKQSDEQSLAEAQRRVENEAKNGYPYKRILTRVTRGDSSSVVTSSLFARDYTYRDLPAVLRAFESQPTKASAPRQMRVGQNVRPGFLIAVADLLYDCTYAFKRSGASGLTARAVQYAYNGQLYDLKLGRPDVLKNARYGDQAYGPLLKGWFELRNRAGGSSEWFQVVWGVQGALEGVPVYIEYQPRWWFKATLVLDDHQSF